MIPEKNKNIQNLMFYTPMERMRTLVLKIIGNAILLFFSIGCLFPIIWILYSSFKTQDEFGRSSLALPTKINISNYISAFTQSHMGIYILNTFRNTIISVVFIMLLSFINGYFLSRFRFKGRNMLYTYFMIGMLIPIHALLVPIYIQMKSAGLSNHWYTLLFPYVAFGLPIGTVLTESFISSIPRDLEEAAAIDGSSFSRTLFSIVLPLTSPILATVGIIQSFAVWNEFSFSLILISSDKLRTVPVGLTTFRAEYFTDYPRLMAGIMIAMVPVMLVYFSFSKRIIQGMTTGAIKG